MTTLSDTLDKIAKWAHDRNLIEGATPQAQMLKQKKKRISLSVKTAMCW